MRAYGRGFKGYKFSVFQKRIMIDHLPCYEV
jgi:hypothetical protein